MACWSDVPREMLSVVAGLLTKNSDYIRFRSVCVSWRQAADPVPRHIPVQPPLLILPDSENQGLLYSPSTNTTQWIHLPEAFQKRCCGSSHGWLAFVDRDPYVFLLNPITGSRIDLPPIIVEPVGRYIFRPAFFIASRKGKPHFYNIQKVVLSANPNSGARWTAVAILEASPQTHHVALWRPGDDKWTLIDRSVCIYDVAFCNGKFYIFGGGGFLLEHDVDSAKTIVHYCCVPCPFTAQNYLVESGGKLLLVIQHQDANRTRGFTILRFNLDGGPKLIVAKYLGGRVIFLGENHSFSFSSTEFIGCRKNCIYFTDDDYLDMKEDFPNRKRDLGMFNVDEDRRITKRLPTFPCYALLTRQPPIWITPSLC